MYTQNKVLKSLGFTIVELLITIVVIAILAAMSIVAYDGIQERASSTAIISQAQAYVKGLKLWELDEGRPTTSSCIAPSGYATCPNANAWNINVPVDTNFMQKLATYSGIREVKLGKWGPSSPVGAMWFHENYYGLNRSVLAYSVGPNSSCGLGNVLSPTPGHNNLTLAGANYTSRGANYTECIVEVSKW